MLQAVATGSSRTMEGKPSWVGGIQMDDLEDWGSSWDDWIYLKKHLNVVNYSESVLKKVIML